MRISVLVPTYNRPADFRRCLNALRNQIRPPEEVLVVNRRQDLETLDVISDWLGLLPIKQVTVDQGGQVYALNAGLDSAGGDIVAITDDDAAPRPDWLAKIENHFRENANLGGVGGRDWTHNGDIEIDQPVVGKIQWFGRVVGNHHLGVGQPRQVDTLKGANMSFRNAALSGIRFDTNLRGAGAQVNNDLAISLEVQRHGWELLYDPAVAVDHYCAPRQDSVQRGQFDPESFTNAAFNLYWSVSRCMKSGVRRSLALFWQSAVGSRSEPGILQTIRAVLRGDPLAVRRWNCSHVGRKEARATISRFSRKRQTSSLTESMSRLKTEDFIE